MDYIKVTKRVYSDYFLVFRLANSKTYKDQYDLGDRVFASWVAKGFYAFSTYDRI